MIKQDTIDRKVKRLENNLNRLERGLYHELSIDYIISQIDWLWKYRYISESKKNDLCDKVIEILKERPQAI